MYIYIYILILLANFVQATDQGPSSFAQTQRKATVREFELRMVAEPVTVKVARVPYFLGPTLLAHAAMSDRAAVHERWGTHL